METGERERAYQKLARVAFCCFVGGAIGTVVIVVIAVATAIVTQGFKDAIPAGAFFCAAAVGLLAFTVTAWFRWKWFQTQVDFLPD